MKIDTDVLTQINDNSDLVEYASQNMELKKRGDNYFTHCPMHTDNTPSLCFNPNANRFYCFSCGIKGGMIGFLMKFENLTFGEAVNKAAKLSNVNLSNLCKSDTMAFLRTARESRKKSEESKMQICHKRLDDNELTKYQDTISIDWLNEGISAETQKLFGVRFDNKSNRIVYPVYDINGNLINIKGRTIIKDYKEFKIPKYINYYPVGVMDYFQSLNITLPYVEGEKELIIFESVKSVMKAYQWGYKNCASAEKHNLTKQQENLAASLKCDIVFAYDTDVNYFDNDVKKSIDKLKKVTNVYIINDTQKLLGGSETKNAPVDLGKDIWEQLYSEKERVL